MSLLGELTVLKAYTFRGSFFAELLDRQVFMYKEQMKEVFGMYLPDLEYKRICILDYDDKDIHAYYSAPALQIVPAALQNGTMPLSSASKPCLDRKVLEDLDMPDIFRLAAPNKHIIVSLPVAESLLRRGIPGIILTHIETA